jgi:septal ring factor EnvC (AmiA/AmiB activator)
VKGRTATTALAALAIAATALIGAAGQSLDQLRGQLDRARSVQQQQRQEAERLQRELGALTRQEATLNDQVKALNARLSGLQREQGSVQARVDDLQRQADAVDQRIARLNTTVEAQKSQVQELIRALYREKSVRYLRLIVRSESISDLLSRVRYVDRLGNHDVRIIADLKNNISALDAEQTTRKALIGDLNRYQVELEGKKTATESARRDYLRSLASLAETKKGRSLLLYQTQQAQAQTAQAISGLIGQVVAEQARLEQERRRREEEERRRREEAERRARELREQEARDAAARAEQARREQAQAEINRYQPPPSKVGAFRFPVDGGEIVTRYGGDSDKWLIRGPAEGSAVRAAAAGTVVAADFLQASIGYYVTIQHTADEFSVYANLQDFSLPQVGASVAAGQVIGYTGGGVLLPTDQLQFQVARWDGSSSYFVDPAGYFR